ncbi:hypothetical protein PG995_006069 [Apiospora arundinis]
MPSILFPRVDCDKDPGSPQCEKPSSGDKKTPIVIGTVVGVALVALFVVLYMFHLRRKRNDEREWPKDPQELDDYGFGSDNAGGVKPPKQTYPGRGSSMPGGTNSNSNAPENPFGNTAEVMGGREQPMGRY